MEPKEAAEWLIRMHDDEPDAPPFEAMDDDDILAMFQPLARAYLMVTAERDKLKQFKEYVHARLDAAGVPADPESPHRAEGCRIGGRLDIVLADRQADDNELTTAEWLKSVGWEMGLHFAAITTAGRHRMEWRAAGMWIGETAIALTITRGQVRRLCAAMGIDLLLTEQAR